METSEGTVLEYNFNNNQPVELVDLTESLLSMADEYRRFLQRNPTYGDESLRLLVKEVRTGSIIAELVTNGAPLMLPVIEHTNNLIAFGAYLEAAYTYFSAAGGADEMPEEIIREKKTLENLSNIVNPVAKDNGSNINFNVHDGGSVVMNYGLDSREANASQNRIRKEIDELSLPESRYREQVLMYWYQARRDLQSEAGDKGIIESITKDPVKTIFPDDRIKKKMLFSPNPFESAYIVDVMVETVQDKPALYKVLRFHEAIPKPD